MRLPTESLPGLTDLKDQVNEWVNDVLTRIGPFQKPYSELVKDQLGGSFRLNAGCPVEDLLDRFPRVGGSLKVE